MAIEYYDIDRNIISLMEWADMYESEKNLIAQEHIGHYFISTVLLGLDHNWGRIFKHSVIERRPIIFETMVFDESPSEKGEDLDNYMERYCTKEEALLGHKRICDEIREGNK